MYNLITIMMIWIGTITDYNVDYPVPPVVVTSQEAMYILTRQPNSDGAYYDGKIFLTQLTANPISKLNDQGVLVHEVYHYIQAKNHLKYKCKNAREAAAYKIQYKWIKRFKPKYVSKFFKKQINRKCLKI